MERNDAVLRRRRQLHLHDDRRPRRPVPGARRARARRPLLCAREIDVPGAMPRVIRVLMHYYAADDHTAAARLPRRGARVASRPQRRSVASAGRGHRVLRNASRGSPSIRSRAGYALPEHVALLASNESPDPPLPEVVEAITRALAALNRYPDPTNAALRQALSDRYGVPADADRDRQRLVRHPARGRRGAARARAPSSSTRGRRSASTRTWRPRRARARSRCRSTTTTATTSTRWRPRSPRRRGW